MLTRSLRQVVRGRVAGYVFQPITSRFLCSAQSPEAAAEAAAAAAVEEESTPLDMTEIRLSTDDTQEQAEVLHCECVRSPPHPIAPRRPPPLPSTLHSRFPCLRERGRHTQTPLQPRNPTVISVAYRIQCSQRMGVKTGVCVPYVPAISAHVFSTQCFSYLTRLLTSLPPSPFLPHNLGPCTSCT